MISVCMASYNGARWIKIQLESILPQLGVDDEVIIVDDASTDDTVAKIKDLKDSRIKNFKNPTNLGVNDSFERALSLAKGNIIFLSDQDDDWAPDKVKTVIAAFEADPDVTLVLSDAEIIDEKGSPSGGTYFAERGAYHRGIIPNIVKSKFLGCAIAFRSELRDKALPFPKHIPGHDMWIGLVNELDGKVCFIDRPLIGYRRHSGNVSPSTRRGLAQMLTWRAQLAWGLVLHLLQMWAAGIRR